MAAFKDWIKKFWKKDKDQHLVDNARGTSIGQPVSAGVSTGLDDGLLGYEKLAYLLSVDTDLISRYIDYEDMDDYPETCLAGESLVFTVERGWVSIQELAGSDVEFHVLSYDKDLRSLVPAKAAGAALTGKHGHSKPMVEVVLDDGRSIRCTADHRFMTKGEKWVRAQDLAIGERLMPGVARMRSLNSEANNPYWQVHQPHHNSAVRHRGDKLRRWTWVHRLVADFINGDGDAHSVHHIDGDTLNNSPLNLEGVDNSEHAHRHIAKLDNTKYFPEWTEERRAQMSLKMRGNTYRRGGTMSEDARKKISTANREHVKSDEWRKKIGLAQPNRIDLDRGQLEGAFEKGGTIAAAARILGVSWSKVKRAARDYDLLSSLGNHRVARIKPIEDRCQVYDITVPGYANFVCNGVVVHNSAALDYYADDSTIPDTVHGKTVWATSHDRVIRDVLDDCLHRRVRIEEDVWVAVRTLCKYGNLFAEIVITDIGVIGLNWLPVPTMRRIVNEKGALIGFAQDLAGKFNFSFSEAMKTLDKKVLPKTEPNSGLIFFYPWEVSHWRLRSKNIKAQYGYSVLDSARWIWKRLQMMEDTALVQKLTRAPGRYAFYVDTGDLPPKDAMALVKKVKSGYKKRRLVDPTTGKLDFKYNPLSPHEDFWIPTRGGQDSTRVEVISGPDVQMMDDVQYFQGKLVTATKVPPEYLGLADDNDRESVASQKDVRFARACMRVQREFIVGLRKVCRIHLAALNIDPDSVEWKLKMSVPSAIFEMQQIEIMNARAGAASSMQDYVSKEWILEHIFQFTADDSAYLTIQKQEELDTEAKSQAATQADIMRMYPEVGQMGAMEASAEGEAPPAVESIEILREDIKSLHKAFKRLNKNERRNRRNVGDGFKRVLSMKSPAAHRPEQRR